MTGGAGAWRRLMPAELPPLIPPPLPTFVFTPGFTDAAWQRHLVEAVRSARAMHTAEVASRPDHSLDGPAKPDPYARTLSRLLDDQLAEAAASLPQSEKLLAGLCPNKGAAEAEAATGHQVEPTPDE
jgi:hypothetical protein